MDEKKSAELSELEKQCLDCEKCNLCAGRHNVVFGVGVSDAEVMFIGEGPGEQEDIKGEPFVGKAGQLLDKILGCVGFSRKENIYICNTLKCRPPENRDPLPEEKAACKEFLDAQVNILKPRIILLCGRVAVNSFLDTKLGITKLRGQWFEGPDFSKMMPIFHPSYLLRNDSREKGSPKWLMWQDIKEVRRVYDQMNV